MLIVNNTFKFSQIDKSIFNTATQLQNVPLTGDFIVHYFADAAGTINIDNE